jgi:hypothetical protein
MTSVMVVVVIAVILFAIWSTGWGQSGAPVQGTGMGEGTGRDQVVSKSDMLPLRQRAMSDAKAAAKYRDEIITKLKELDVPAAQPPPNADLTAAQREEKEHLTLQRTEARRELEWVEARLHALSKK